NPTHHAGGDTKEMGAVLPCHSLLIYKAQIGFVEQGRSLKSMIWTLTPHIFLRKSVKFVIDQRHEPFEGFLFSCAPLEKELCQLVLRTHTYKLPKDQANNEIDNDYTDWIRLRKAKAAKSENFLRGFFQ